jgi:hypothetical protein
MPMLRGDASQLSVSRGNAGYAVVFSLIWFGAIVGFLIIPWLHTNGWTLGIVAASLVALLIALFRR